MRSLLGRESGEDGLYAPILYNVFYAWKNSSMEQLRQLPSSISPITLDDDFEAVVNSTSNLHDFIEFMVWLMRSYNVDSLMHDFFRDVIWAVPMVFDECYTRSPQFRLFCTTLTQSTSLEVVHSYYRCSQSSSYAADKINTTIVELNALKVKPDLGYVVMAQKSNVLLMTLATRAEITYEIADISSFVTAKVFVELLKISAIVSGARSIVMHCISYRHYEPLNALAAYRQRTVVELIRMVNLANLVAVYEFNEALMYGGPYEDEKYDDCEVNCLNELCMLGRSRYDALSFIIREGRYRNLFRTNTTNDTMAYLYMICDWPLRALQALYSTTNYDFQELMTNGPKRFKPLYLAKQEEVPVNTSHNCFAALVRKM